MKASSMGPWRPWRLARPAGAVPGAFGAVDTLKLRSCLTLFEAVVPEESVFARVLARHFGDVRCGATLGDPAPHSAPAHPRSSTPP